MNKRIKAIYLLTILGIVAFCALEGYWLHGQLSDYLVEKSAEMYLDVVEIADSVVARQMNSESPRRHALHRISNVSNNDTTRYSGYIALLSSDVQGQEAYMEIVNQIDSGITPAGVEHLYRFEDIDVSNVNTKDFQDAANRFCIYKLTTFDTESLIAETERLLGADCSAELIEVEPNRVWKAKIVTPDNIFRPRVGVVYPYNPFEGGAVRIMVDIPLGDSLRDMALTFTVAIAVAIMLITCLILQILTIRRQQRIADFQKGYTLTMLHELKRPIGALKLFISFMRNPKISESDRREALDNGAQEVDNLSSYFEKLRAITYSEAYDAPLSLSTFDLAEAARECAAKSGADVNVHADGPALVTAERQSILNVIANLIENAAKYSPTHSLIDLTINVTDSAAAISVADRGPGIADADKERIFNRFCRVGNSREVPGIGLGLAYVRQVVTAHGGTVTVSDRDGGGSVFTINLPQ